MDKTQKQKNQKQTARHPNPLESLKDIGDIGKSTVNSLKKDLVEKMPQDVMDQLFGSRPIAKYSGEIAAGESLELNEVYTGREVENKKLKGQLALERRLRDEESALIEKKSNDLKIQLKVLMDEIYKLAGSTQKLAEETQIAAMQAPIEPGVYHLIFFEKLLEFVQSFRKKVEESVVWLHATNKRAARKNAWGQRYKQHGGKYLLSGEHYLQRSAG